MSTPAALRFSEKWKTLFIPFVLVVVAYWAFYAVFHVVLYLKMEVTLVDRDRFILAYSLLWVFLLLTIWPRVKKLEFSRDWGHYFYTGFLSILLMIPLNPGMLAVERLAGKNVVINKPEDYVPADFYKIKQYYVAKENARFISHTRTSGRLNNQLDMYLYAVMPILEDSTASRAEPPVLWYGKVYRKTVKNKDTAAKVEGFVQNSVNSFQGEKSIPLGELQRIGLSGGGEHYRKLLDPGAVLLVKADPLGKTLRTFGLTLLAVISFQLLALLGVKVHRRGDVL